MSHFLTGVILPLGLSPADEDHIRVTVDELLKPYDEGREVRSHPVYVKGGALVRMKRYYRVRTAAECLPHLRDWTGCPGGLDKHGLYYLSRYNPDSRWDWYVIGGRWNGVIAGKPRDDDQGGFNFANEFHQLSENVATVKDAAVTECFAFVLPDEKWLAAGDMGWWGMVSNEASEDKWNAALQELAAKYADHLIVGVDCHI
jgi:hypothetical protein